MSGAFADVAGHEAAHATFAWRSPIAEVVSITLPFEPHVQMNLRFAWNQDSREALIYVVGELAEDPHLLDDLGRYRRRRTPDARSVLSACAIAGHCNGRGQMYELEWLRFQALDLLEVWRDGIDRVALALAAHQHLDAAQLEDILGPQTLTVAPLAGELPEARGGA